jgi:hypothetical protein
MKQIKALYAVFLFLIAIYFCTVAAEKLYVIPEKIALCERLGGEYVAGLHGTEICIRKTAIIAD